MQAPVRSVTGSANALLAAEAATAGLAFGSVLWWASTCLVSTFRPQDLPAPYWDGIPWLRTDTSGFAAFILAAISITCSKYLRLRRLEDADRKRAAMQPVTSADVVLALSETGVILATGLVVYLSLNTITHPASLQIQVSHLLSWPTEGTLRMMALMLCAFCMAIHRYLRPSGYGWT
jgi:hypothetical protein